MSDFKHLLGCRVVNNKNYTDQFPFVVVGATADQNGKLLLQCLLAEGNTRGDTVVFAFTDVQFDPAFLADIVYT